MFDLNIWRQDLSFRSYNILPYTFTLFYLVFCFLVYSMLKIYFAFNCQEINKKHNRWAQFGIIIFIILLFTGLEFAVVYPDLRFLFLIVDSLSAILIVLEIIILIRIFVKSDSFCIATNVTKSFSVLFLLRYLFILGFSLKFLEPFGSALTIFLIQIVPLIWIKSYVDKIEQKSIDSYNKDINPSEIAKQFQLSKRETEIFLLIIQGMNNKEIQDELFISYHTVKNHVYNIFQKMNVKNRYQLMKFISKND